MPLQASLIATARQRTHMALGGTSVALAAVTVFTGILVASVRINQGQTAIEPDEFTTFWKDFGQLIMYNMILFIGFYGTAAGEAVSRVMALFARVFGGLY